MKRLPTANPVHVAGKPTERLPRKKELYRGKATLAFNSATADPLGSIPVLEIISGEQSIEDMSLDCGDVLFDYLTQNQE